MKSIFSSSAVVLLLSFGSFAQGVGVNETGASPDESAILDVSSTVKGVLVPRMTTAQRVAITSPATGLLVYDSDSNGFWFYNGVVWMELSSGTQLWSADGNNVSNSNSGNVGVGTDTPQSKLQVGDFSNSTEEHVTVAGAGGNNSVSGVKMRHFNDNYGFTIESNDIPPTQGLNIKRHVDNPTGESAIFIQSGSGNVGINTTTPEASAALEINSTMKGFLPPRMTTAQRNAIVNPASGLMVFNTTLSCLQVNDGTPNAPQWNCISNSAGIPDGSIATINCAGANNNGILAEQIVASGVNFIIPYTGGNGGLHGGQVVLSTGVTGLTATLAAGAFANGVGNLTYTISGTPAMAGTASFAINIGGQSCTLSRTVAAVLPNICNPSNPTLIVDVTNGNTGKTWMDRNLGANRKAISSTDAQSYGSLYQWGRGSDGHQCVNRYAGDGVTTSGTTANQSSSDTPGHDDFITLSLFSTNWRSPQNDNLWQGVSGTNNPCPTGYRLPTYAELNTERLSWSSNNTAGAFASPLKLPLAGSRDLNDGLLNSVNSYGFYWSSTVSSSFVYQLLFESSVAALSAFFRGTGSSVRCIKN